MPTPSDHSLGVVRASVPAGRLAACETALEDAGLPCASWHEDAAERAVIECYVESPADAEARRAAMAQVLAAVCSAGECALTVATLAPTDWTEAWKRYFHAERVSDRVVVRPPWETIEIGPGDYLVTIEPGMSFGTGSHATTRGCLTMLDALAAERPGASLVDLGCGSGILSIAGAMLGYAPIRALDADPEAVRTARENAAANLVADRIAFAQADVLGDFDAPPADVVVANILADVLLAAAAAIAGRVGPGAGSRLILAGILAEQETDIGNRYAAEGFRVDGRVEDGDWITLRLRRRNGA